MPFVALDKKTGNRVDITKIKDPRQELDKDNIICQLCKQPMIIKAGMIIRHHFAHYVKCDTDIKHHPESPEHNAAKEEVAKALKKDYEEYSSASVDYEVIIPEIKRRADIMITFPMGWRIAHEIQLSSITVEDLQNRTDDYRSAGIDVVWWLGKSADTPANRSWCLETFGISLCISIEELQSRTNVLQKT